MGVYELQKDKYMEINQIKNISCIKIYDLLNSIAFNEHYGITGLLVFYDNGYTLNFTLEDEEFVYFFETVRRVYNKEKVHNYIYVDSKTEYFLNSLNPRLSLEQIKSQVGFIGHSKKEIYYNIKSIESDYKILEYIIENLLSFFGRSVDIIDVKGVGENFALKIMEKGYLNNLSFKYLKKSDSKFLYIFKGLLDLGKELYLEINYEEGFEVSFYDSGRSIFGRHKVDRESCTFITEMYIDGVLKSKQFQDLSKVSQDNYKLYLEDDEKNYDFYLLPWGDIVSINESVKSGEITKDKTEKIEFTESGISITSLKDESFRVEERKKSFIYISNNKHVRVYRKGEIIKTEYNPSFYKLNKISLKTCVESSFTNYYYVGDSFIVKETLFIPSLLGSGMYKSDLEGKTFYKVYETILGETVREYSTVKEGIKGYQLIDANELKLVLGRGVK